MSGHSFSDKNQRHLSRGGAIAARAGQRSEGVLDSQAREARSHNQHLRQLRPSSMQGNAALAQNSWRPKPDIQGREWDRAE